MDRSLARYPFREAARDAVRKEAPPIERLLAADGPSAVLERATERVERALSGPTTGSPHPDPEVELLSYPIARIIVSLVDDPLVTDRFVRAEARTAVQRFRADRLTDRVEAIDEGDLFAELAIEIRDRSGRPAVDRASYLRLAPDLDGPEWRLVNRSLAAGWVLMERDELPALLEAAVRDRVGRDLPLSVPADLADRLEGAVGDVEARLGRPSLPESFGSIDPDRFPPCMQALLDRVRAGDRLGATSRYALAAFLTSIGLDPEDFDTVVGESSPPELEAMGTTLAGDEGPTQFPPGSCETMVVFGDCIDPDDLCERIENPLEYYARRQEGETP